jgi:hypothetical protein
VVDDVPVRSQVVLVLVVVGLVSSVPASVVPTLDGAGLAWALQQAVLEVVEGAYARDIFGMEAADENVEGLVAHHLDPHGEAGDAAQRHSQTGTEHADWVACWSSFVLGIPSG